MQIGEKAHATGFSPDTLRYYEKIGLLPPHRSRRLGPARLCRD